MKKPHGLMQIPISAVLSVSLILAFTLSAFLVAPARADCPDGTSADNTLTCNTDTGVFNTWDGKNGDDNMTQEDTSEIDWNVSGGKGDDSITINGEVGDNLLGDSVYGDGILSGGFATGGDDVITINGDVSGDVMGDGILNLVGGDGGDDTIEVNGSVGGDVVGDGVTSLFGGSGGDDVIVINGTVEGDVLADGVNSFHSDGGDDDVAVGEGATIMGILDGGKGEDSLSLLFIYQDELDVLDPMDGTISFGEQTYTWINFEELIGKIREIVAELVGSGNARAIVYLNGSLLGVNEADGIKVFSEVGTVAYIPFAELAALLSGDSATYQTPNSGGWYVVATDLGVNPDNPGNHLYQISIYNPSSSLQGQFTVAN